MKTVQKVQGTANVARIVDVLISAGSSGQTAFFSGLQQAVENAFDAGAEKFEISLNKKNNTLILSDDGAGFGHEELKAFFSLYVSSKDAADGLIGKNGSGRIFLLQIAKALNVHTKSETFPSVMNFSLDRNDLEVLLSGGKIQQAIPVNTPEWFIHKGTGTTIQLNNVDWSRIPSEKKILSDFASFLSPSIARMVTVNGKELEPRPVVGNVISQSFSFPGISSDIQVELFLPEKTRQGEGVNLGAYNPIMGLKAFAEQSPIMISSDLWNGSVCGNIFIPDLNPYRGHDGKSYEDKFYKTKLYERVAAFLNDELTPIVREEFARKKSEEDQERQKMALKDVSSILREAYGGPKTKVSSSSGLGTVTKKKLEPKLRLDPKGITLLAGESVKVSVKGNDISDDIRWEIKGGGSLSAKKGSSVWFTAGQSGKTIITAKDPKSGIEGKTSVSVVLQDDVSISPRYVEVEPGQKRVFSIKTKNTDFVPEWVVSSADLKPEILSGNKVSVSTDTPGTYRIGVKNSSGDTVATADMVVIPASKELNNVIVLDGHEYQLELSTMPVRSVVSFIIDGKINPNKGGSGAIDVLSVDMSHRLITSTRHLTSSADANLNALLPFLVSAHLNCQAEKSGLPLIGAELAEKTAEICGDVMQARSRSKRSR